MGIPEPGRLAPKLLINGTVHSAAEPYAEAMLIQNAQVAWLGSDETAETMPGEQQDLQRGLVTPGFAGAVTLTLEEASAATVTEVLNVAAANLGYTVTRLLFTVSVEELTASSERVLRTLREAFESAAAHPVKSFPALSLSGVRADGGAPSIAAVNTALDLLDDLDDSAEQRPGLQLDIEDVMANLLGVRSWVGEAQRQLLLDCASSDPGVVAEAMATTQNHLRALRQLPSADQPTVLIGFDSGEREHWQTLLNTGVHVLLRTPSHLATALSVGVPTSAAPVEGENPWQLVSDHVHYAQDPVSARAAFNAQTRAAYRSLPGGSPDMGQLNVGSPATFGIWAVETLSVQTPHSTTAAWSTDTRARTPLLPHVGEDSLPQLLSTVIHGQVMSTDETVAHRSAGSTRGEALKTNEAE